ncbi:hypothetical protein J2I47_12705 [Fibrella sp. HMF5335]|uniref:Uncharacterized protein n=1 Tax=Fibrella rubiginis TaxID=2817060 RepID=A0A939GGL2_9BACT|nr:hypothetical protein [Fibrella rubiginis]MBO0937408.1 hypothetical protein [Fibrella rubiginis]
MDIEERIDRIELRLVELELKMDHLLDLHEKLLALGLTLNPQELEEVKIKVAQLSLDLGSRQN